MNIEKAIEEIREVREIDERKDREARETPEEKAYRCGVEAERARCIEMLKRCRNVYRRNQPPRIERREAFMKETALDYALMVVGDWSLSEEYREDMMPLPY